MIYVLAYPRLAPDLAKRIDRFRSAHEPDRARLVPPHITLVFGLTQADPIHVLTLCRRVASQTPALAIAFVDSTVVYDPFEKTHKLFLVCGEGKAALTALHGQLYDGPHRAEQMPGLAYSPHMTVATHADRSYLERLDVAEIGAFPMAGVIDALEVIHLVEGTLQTVGCAPLALASGDIPER